jgi:hypothetical protein
MYPREVVLHVTLLALPPIWRGKSNRMRSEGEGEGDDRIAGAKAI